MLKGAEERSFVMRARVDDEMGRSAERERFPALVASETRTRNETKNKRKKKRSEQSPITTGMANGQRAIEGNKSEWMVLGQRASCRREEGTCKEAFGSLDLVPFPAFPGDRSQRLQWTAPGSGAPIRACGHYELRALQGSSWG